MGLVILRNAAECVGCHQLIESRHRRDFRSHHCPGVWFFVDGGRSYFRRGWAALTTPAANYINRNVEVDSRIYDNCLRGY